MIIYKDENVIIVDCADVALLAVTPNAENIVLQACQISHMSDNEKLLPKVMALGHMSVLEHVSYTFRINNISRAASHQLVRHRIASYTQQSFRYTKADKAYLPPGLSKDPEAIEDLANRFCEYQERIRDGSTPEDARYLLPNSVASDIIMTMNARELRSFLHKRLAPAAQYEIRMIAQQIHQLAKEATPTLMDLGIAPGKE